MKFYLSFLFLTITITQAQTDKTSSIFVDLKEIEEPPTYIGCENQDFNACSLKEIISFFYAQADPKIVDQTNPGDRIINLKFIVDSHGKVRKAMAQAKSEVLITEANRILYLLPNFNPGIHRGENVNVIFNLFLKLPIIKTLDANSEAIQIKPLALKCKEVEDPKRCTSQFVQDFVNRYLDTSKIRTKGVKLETKISFVIDENGKVTEVVAKGNNNELNKEGIRVAKRLPNFIPGKMNGNKVRASYDFSLYIYEAN